MQSFSKFLSQTQGIDSNQLPHFLRWVTLYVGQTHKENVNGKTMNFFLQWLSSRYTESQVKQARHALQLYSYYRARNGFAEAEDLTAPVPKVSSPVPANWNLLEEEFIRVIRLKHFSYRTEKSYLSWILRLKAYVRGKSCAAVTEQDVKSFLSFLAVEKKVSAATQRLAFNALLFLCRNLLSIEINGLQTVVPSRIPRRLPVVLTQDEVRTVLAKLDGSFRLMASLIYGGGLRLQECPAGEGC